jgi:hypothetical protein
MDKAEDLLSSPPDIKPVDVLAAKLPGGHTEMWTDAASD